MLIIHNDVFCYDICIHVHHLIIFTPNHHLYPPPIPPFLPSQSPFYFHILFCDPMIFIKLFTAWPYHWQYHWKKNTKNKKPLPFWHQPFSASEPLGRDEAHELLLFGNRVLAGPIWWRSRINNRSCECDCSVHSLNSVCLCVCLITWLLWSVHMVTFISIFSFFFLHSFVEGWEFEDHTYSTPTGMPPLCAFWWLHPWLCFLSRCSPFMPPFSTWCL